MTRENTRSRYFGIGAVIYAFVSALWLMIEWSLGSVQNVFVTGTGGVLILILLILAVRHIMQSPEYVAEQGDKTGMWFGIIFAWEGIGIGVVSGILIALQLESWIPIAVAVIVGLHFFPLGYLLDIQADYLVGAALLAIAVATPILVASPDSWVSIVAYGAAITLFIAGCTRLTIGRSMITA